MNMDVRTFPDQPRLLISRDSFHHNLRLIRQRLLPGTKICAMVKADAYGHGADLICDTLCNFESEHLPTPAVDMLGVGCMEEAAALAETSLPVLVLRAVENGYVGPARAAIEHAIRSGWVLTIGSLACADDIARIAMSIKKRAMVHVMIDSGMTRCGCSIEQITELLKKIELQSSLSLYSLGTHLATADVPNDPYITEQLGRFRSATDAFVAARERKPIRTVANSGGIFFAPSTHMNMVRPGISLYGIDPTCRPNMNRPLKPVAKWVANLISILDAKQGSSIGYGRTWRAERDTRIGLVPVGYGDGYPRCLGNKAMMIVNGIVVPVVGRVSMDLITLDLHDVPQAQVGDDVIVMDDDPLSPASAYALAELAHTIPYELFTRIGPRVKRVAELRATAENPSTTMAR